MQTRPKVKGFIIIASSIIYNPTIVVSLLIVNSDNLPPSQFDTVFKAAGVDTISYAPDTAIVQAPVWPTLGTLIDSGKRLVTFLSTTADFTAVPYLIDGTPPVPHDTLTAQINNAIY